MLEGSDTGVEARAGSRKHAVGQSRARPPEGSGPADSGAAGRPASVHREASPAGRELTGHADGPQGGVAGAIAAAASESGVDGFEPTPSGYMPSASIAGLDSLCAAVAADASMTGSWGERIRVGLSTLLAFLEDESEWTRVLVLEAPLVGVTTRECARRTQRALRPVLQQAREEIIVGAEIRPSPALIAELLVLGVLSVIRSRLLKGETLRDLGPSLMTHIVGPYLGRGAAKADRAEARGGGVSLDPRAEMVPIRPHPRTLQALRVIAAAPRLSTREVGRAIGIDNNSGHIPGLLRRLEQRGLIETAGSRGAGHRPSTWFLTPYGDRVLEVIASTFASAESAVAPLMSRTRR
jgi:hypothetical protein